MSSTQSSQPTKMSDPQRTGRKTFRIVAIAAALALIAGIALPLIFPPSKTVKGNPMPTLFADDVISPLALQIDDQRRKATTLIATWQAQHGTGRDDAAFEDWAAAQIPPPNPASHAAEMQQVEQLAAARTASGVTAATWLELYGKKAIWKLYLGTVRDTVTNSESKADKAALKSAMTIADTLTVRLADKYQSSSPYVLEPSLRPDKTVAAGSVCPCSYPSKHAALSVASVELLTSLNPHAATEYDWMAAEVAYSRVYEAGHFTSDILAGALLGALTGDYIALTMGKPLPSQPAWPSPSASYTPALPDSNR